MPVEETMLTHHVHVISSQAWDVPNSNLVVNLKKMNEQVGGFPYANQNSCYYMVGVAQRSPSGGAGVGYSMFHERGSDPYEAFENLMAKIDKVVDAIFKIIDSCDNGDSVKVVNGHQYEGLPIVKEDLSMQFFFSTSRMISLMEKSGEDAVLEIRRLEMGRGHVTNYGVIRVGQEILFSGKPAYDKKDALGNVKNAVLGAAALLEKFQGMAWNVMIDSNDSKYDVVASRTGLTLKERNAEKEVESA